MDARTRPLFYHLANQRRAVESANGGDSMKSPTGTHTSNAWMIRTGWVLSGLSSAFIIVDGLMKLLPPDPAFLEELGAGGRAIVAYAAERTTLREHPSQRGSCRVRLLPILVAKL
jgi:hypothetical protein